MTHGSAGAPTYRPGQKQSLLTHITPLLSLSFLLLRTQVLPQGPMGLLVTLSVALLSDSPP